MGAPLLALAATLAWGLECPDRDALTDELQSAVVEADLDAAEAHLAALEHSFACGEVVEPKLLGRIWLLEGALLTFRGEPEAALESWVAAERVAPSLWIADLGDPLRADYEAARAAEGTGHIDIEPPLFWGAIAAIDGQMVSTPFEIPPGLHLVQAGPAGDAISFGKIIAVSSNSTAVVSTGLAPPDATPAPIAAQEPESVAATDHGFSVHISGGAIVTMGDALDGPGSGDEPATKLSIPLELGLQRNFDGAWFRAAASVAPLVGGRYLYSDGAQINGSSVGIGGNLAGGWLTGPLRVGGLGGVSWPGRITTRAVLASRLGDLPLSIEIRGGLNLATEREPEPAFGALLVFNPYL